MDLKVGAALVRERRNLQVPIHTPPVLAQVCTRDHAAVSVDACCASALAKLLRRCPYMFGGEEARTREEAEA